MKYLGWIVGSILAILGFASIASALSTFLVTQGGTGAASFGQGFIYSSGGTAALSASTSAITVNHVYATSTTATSTFSAGVSALRLNWTATSTGSNGINLTGGCFAISGTCLSAGSGTVTQVSTTYPVTGGPFTTTGTIAVAFGTTTSNTWAGLQSFGNATSTLFTATTGWIGTLNLTNALTVANGGTGATTLTGCLTGNGTGAITGSGTCNTSAASVTSVNNGSTGSTLTFTGGPVTTSGTINGEINLSHSNTWSALQIFSSGASSTVFSNFGTAYFGGNSTTTISSTGSITAPSGVLNTFPNATTTNLTAGSSNYAVNPLTALPISIASSTWGIGTTTATIMATSRAITMVDVSCANDTGLFLDVDFYYGSTHLNYLTSSSTINKFVFSTNNVIAAGQKVLVDIGTSTTPAAGYKKFNCTPEWTYNGSS